MHPSQDYLDSGVPAFFGTPYMERLAQAIDPLNFKENLTMSKLIVDSTGDEFFQVQDDSVWWGQLPGETLRLMVVNAEHSFVTGLPELLPGADAWAMGLFKGLKAPMFTWNISDVDGSITVHVDPSGAKPTRVVQQMATTLDSVRRDFRLVSGDTPANPCKYIPVDLFGKACLRPMLWFGVDVGLSASDTYQVALPPAPAGLWRGLLAELHFAGPAGTSTEYILTSQVSVWPNTYPFPPCNGQSCMGELV